MLASMMTFLQQRTPAARVRSFATLRTTARAHCHPERSEGSFSAVGMTARALVLESPSKRFSMVCDRLGFSRIESNQRVRADDGFGTVYKPRKPSVKLPSISWRRRGCRCRHRARALDGGHLPGVMTDHVPAVAQAHEAVG